MQREVFELRLQQLGIPFRLRNTQSVEEPGAQYRTFDPALLELSPQDIRNIEQGMQEALDGKTIPLSDIENEIASAPKSN